MEQNTTSLGSSNDVGTYDQLHSQHGRASYIASQHGRATYVARAYRAYLGSNFCPTPSERYSGTFNDYTTGRNYIYLGDCEGVLLAIYRVDSRGKLRRLKLGRWSWSRIFLIEERSGLHQQTMMERGNNA